ncbi:MAG: hypothetical protein AAF515_05030 [Pseudomonadota bacterium]
MRLPAATANAISDDASRLVWFAEIQFDSGTVRVHTDIGEITTLGQTWVGLGALAGIGPLEETTTLTADKIDLRLSGLDDSIVPLVVDENYRFRRVAIYLAAMDPRTARLVEPPTEAATGMMNGHSLPVGEEGGDTLTLTVEHELANLKQSSGRLLTSEHHQVDYPGDLILEYLPQVAKAKPVWRGTGGTPIRSNRRRVLGGFTVPGLS